MHYHPGDLNKDMKMFIGELISFIAICLVLECGAQHHPPVFGQPTVPEPPNPEFASKIPVPPGSQIVYCPAGPPGPPGPPGPTGAPGRDGRDGRDCPPCQGSTTSPFVPSPQPVPTPAGPCPSSGSALHPVSRSCHDLWLDNPQCKAHSGTYWLEPGDGRPSYSTYCEMVPVGDLSGGWTLVARANGHSTEFSPTSSHWTSSSVINGDTGSDVTVTSTMKNVGWSSIPGNIIKVCYSGPHTNCASFTHSKGVPLSELFAHHFAVHVAEKYTFEGLMKKFGKHLYLGRLKTEWCGLNLGDLCNLAANPNLHPTGHVCRIGCIGDSHPAHSAQSCKAGSYALGIGVSSCTDHHGCRSDIMGSIKSLHYGALNTQFGSFMQTAFIYVK